MTTVAAIVTLYSRPHNIPRLSEAWGAQVRMPDELWLIGEGRIMQEVYRSEWPDWLHIRDYPTPRNQDGSYAVVPYSNKINHALDHTKADYIVYGTDDSFPAHDKIKIMAAALDANDDWGAVYCEQSWRSPAGTEGHRGNMGPVDNAHSLIDHTQVMHRRTADRWTLNMSQVRLGDATFWMELHKSLGAFMPVPFTLDRTEQTPDGISFA